MAGAAGKVALIAAVALTAAVALAVAGAAGMALIAAVALTAHGRLDATEVGVDGSMSMAGEIVAAKASSSSVWGGFAGDRCTVVDILHIALSASVIRRLPLGLQILPQRHSLPSLRLPSASAAEMKGRASMGPPC
jgi:hypothetical protein